MWWKKIKKEISKYSNKEYILTKSEEKIYNILETFYIKLDKKYLNTDIKKIKILENINFKIKKLKLKNKNNKKVLNILNYIEYNISNRIFWYNYQIFEDTLGNKNILIKTDFEKDIFLKEKISEQVWWQDFWWKNINLKWYETKLQFIVDWKSDINKYAETEIKQTLTNENKHTKALYLNIKKFQRKDTQIPLITYTDWKEIENLNIKYSLKFPKNLSDKLWKNGWAVISEYKTTWDFRLAIYVYSDEKKDLYWYMHWDNVVNDPEKYEEFWYKENKKIAVPVWEWFDVNISWKRWTTNWKVDFLVNNKNVLNYVWKTKIKDNIDAIMYFTNYSSNPIDIWIDNFEVSN